MLEAVLFASGDPVSAAHLAEILETPEEDVLRALTLIGDDCAADDRGVTLLQLEDKWQFATKNECADAVRRALDKRRNTPLSPAAFEVLAIIAYNQPVSRSFIEQVRGVDSSSTVQTLLQKGLVEEAGRLDLPGRPISFRTTDVFLRTFGISSLAQLPPLHGDDYVLEQGYEDAEGVADADAEAE